MINVNTQSFLSLFFALLVCVSLSGCYHATITTGLTPGTQVIDEPWAAGWVFGLVPPETVETASQCPAGVAKVETQHSFLNQVVGGLTFGIFSPMHITVTCAATSSDSAPSISVPEGAGQEEVIQAFDKAADDAAESGQSVFVHFE